MTRVAIPIIVGLGLVSGLSGIVGSSLLFVMPGHDIWREGDALELLAAVTIAR